MLFRINIDRLQEIDWHVAIFDEAHKLKNKRVSTKNDNISTYGAATSLRTKRRYGLTGTAMQVKSQLLITCWIALSTPSCISASVDSDSVQVLYAHHNRARCCGVQWVVAQVHIEMSKLCAEDAKREQPYGSIKFRNAMNFKNKLHARTSLVLM